MTKLLDYFPFSSRVLIVAVQGDINDWTAYIDAVNGNNHDIEAHEVMRTGTKVPYEVAKVIFPHIDKRLLWRK